MQEIFNFNSFFKKKKYLITGSSSYLAEPVVNFLLNKGSIVVCIGRVNSFKRKKNLFFFKCDMQNENEINAAYNLIKKKFDFFNGLIHFASEGTIGHYSKITKKDFDISFNINVVSLFLLIKKFKKLFYAGYRNSKNKSSIINFSSMYGLNVPDFDVYKNKNYYNPIQYGCSKAAMIHMTKYLSKNKDLKYIKINNVVPGAFPKTNKNFQKSINKKKLLMKIPMSRFGEPEDILGSVIFLLSDMSDYMTGTSLTVDGGFTA